jgi:hypothetical protein
MLAAADPILSNRGEEEEERDLSMNALWIVVGIGIFGVLAKRVAWAYERGRQSALGFVSHQWLAEHRLSQLSDPQR